MSSRIHIRTVPLTVDVRHPRFAQPRGTGGLASQVAPSLPLWGFLFYTYNQSDPNDFDTMLGSTMVAGYQWTTVWKPYLEAKLIALGKTPSAWIIESGGNVTLNGVANLVAAAACNVVVLGHAPPKEHIQWIKANSLVPGGTRVLTGLHNFESCQQATEWQPVQEAERLLSRKYVLDGITSVSPGPCGSPFGALLSSYGCAAIDQYEYVNAPNWSITVCGTDLGPRAPTGNNAGWTNPSNAHADGGGYASTVTLDAIVTYNGHNFNATQNLPNGAPNGPDVNGITIRLDALKNEASGSGTLQLSVRLSWNGGTSWTAAKVTGNLTTSEATYTLGGAADTWGRTWTFLELNTNNFRVEVKAVGSGISGTPEWRLDFTNATIKASWADDGRPAWPKDDVACPHDANTVPPATPHGSLPANAALGTKHSWQANTGNATYRADLIAAWATRNNTRYLVGSKYATDGDLVDLVTPYPYEGFSRLDFPGGYTHDANWQSFLTAWKANVDADTKVIGADWHRWGNCAVEAISHFTVDQLRNRWNEQFFVNTSGNGKKNKADILTGLATAKTNGFRLVLGSTGTFQSQHLWMDTAAGPTTEGAETWCTWAEIMAEVAALNAWDNIYAQAFRQTSGGRICWQQGWRPLV